MNSFAFIFGCLLVTFGLVKVAEAIRWCALSKITVHHRLSRAEIICEPIIGRQGWVIKSQ